MHSFSFYSHLIRYSDAGHTFKDNQRALKHLRHSESTRALGQSEGTQRALGGHSGTPAVKAFGHSDTYGTQALRHLSTRVLGHLENLGTRAFEALYLADSGLNELGYSIRYG